jgi:hypothetical protein
MADFFLGGQIDPAQHQRTGMNTAVPSGDLTTHGVIVGMTGSGKTGLGVVLIEEALSAGVPTLLIDPKGDLTNLCLTFPALAPTDFEPWVNEGDAQKAGASVAEFAAAQATTWTDGLAGWGITAERVAALRERAAFTIYTPGSTGGVGLNIVGSLAAPMGVTDPEILGDEIDGFVSGLLGLVGVDADPLTSREHILLSNLVMNEWSAGRDLDLPTLVGLVQSPPLRKLGVFDLDQFFAPKDRTAFAMRLNGLLASPSFGAWMAGTPLDIDSMLRTDDGRPRCAIVTTAHLGDQERQFVTTLVLSKLVTWMRKQSGTTDLRVLLYMDEVAGYLPPTAAPPTKKPIMTLMKQARAFGVGVVLSTQNPVDVDYKALSNAGTWMIGRLQTDRDKARLLDGMSAASGGVDVKAVGDTISGLAKREFVLRRAGKDQPEVFTTRWAMSYLRGPLTRDQIAVLMAEQKNAPTIAPTIAPASAPSAPPAPAPAGTLPPPTGAPAAPPPPTATVTAHSADDATSSPVMPKIAEGVAVRWVDPAAPWLTDVGADPAGTTWEPAFICRVAMRFDDDKADFVHDQEFEAVLFPLTEQIDASRPVDVDYDDRDLRGEPPSPCTYRLPDAPVQQKTYFSRVERDLIDALVLSRNVDMLANKDLKVFGRPGETPEAFAVRCHSAAGDLADAETAKLRTKYETKLKSLQTQLATAEDRAHVLQTQMSGKRTDELVSAAGSILDGFLGGRRSRGSLISGAARRRSSTQATGAKLDAAENKIQLLQRDLADLEQQLVDEVQAITEKWNAVALDITTVSVPLERTDIKVVQRALVWLPVP